MARRLSHNLTSDYIEAMNRMQSKRARQKVIAYVESYDDVFFWRNLLSGLENQYVRFEVMLPSRQRLSKGKKEVLANLLGKQLGNYMIACVDADYDYLLQSNSTISARVCQDPWVFHTYVYAIENFRCYAPALHNVCVLSTLNDHRIFDYEEFLKLYSRIIWPLFVWNVWAYKYNAYRTFSLMNFYHIVQLTDVNYYHPEDTLAAVQKAVSRKLNWMQHKFPEGRETYKPLEQQLRDLGVTPDTTYLYMRGHDLVNGVVLPLLTGVCNKLRKEKEKEIHRLAVHHQQANNELSGYRNSALPLEEVLRHHTEYTRCPQYLQVQNDIQALVNQLSPAPPSTPTDAPS